MSITKNISTAIGVIVAKNLKVAVVNLSICRVRSQTMKVLDRYIAGILLHGFFSALGIIGGLLILHRFYRIIELAVTRSLSEFQILSLLVWIFPLILFHAIPVAAIVGTLLAFGRLASGSEICAMLAAGAGRLRIAFFPLLFSAALMLFALFNNLYLMPEAYFRFDSAQFGAGIDPIKGLKPGIVERIAGRHIAVGAINPDANTFQKLFAVIPSPFKAAEGERLLLLSDSGTWTMTDSAITLNLHDGSLRALGAGAASASAAARTMRFGNYTLQLPLPDFRPPDPKRRHSLVLYESGTKGDLAELFRRILSACIIPIFVVSSIPLVATSRFTGRRSHARGAVWYSVLIYFLYWLLFFMADSLVDKYGFELPWLSLPHGALTLLSFVLWRVRR